MASTAGRETKKLCRMPGMRSDQLRARTSWAPGSQYRRTRAGAWIKSSGTQHQARLLCWWRSTASAKTTSPAESTMAMAGSWSVAPSPI